MDRDLDNGKESAVIDTEGRGTGGVAAWVEADILIFKYKYNYKYKYK